MGRSMTLRALAWQWYSCEGSGCFILQDKRLKLEGETAEDLSVENLSKFFCILLKKR